MAITINGSGTITGISAGGLPDGSVTAADLADTYLTGVTSSDLPSGSVLQVVQTYSGDTGYITTTSTSYVASGISVSITPTSTSNFIVVQMFNPMVDHNGSDAITGAMYVNGVGMSGSNVYHLGYQDYQSRYASWNFAAKYNPTSLAELTFEPYFKSGNGGVARFSHNYSSISLIAMEIAG